MKRTAFLAIALLGACHRTPERAVGDDFALTSANIALPNDAEPALPDVLAANCGACHSAGMILTQPTLKPEQWAATIKKMREVYKAPIADTDVPTILAALAKIKPGALPAAPATAATAAP